MRKSLIGLGLVLTTLASTAQAEGKKLDFPADYKSTFTNYLSLDRTQNPDQLIRLFGNDAAMKGPGPDGKLPFGSVLVAEIYKAKKAKDGTVLTSALGRRIRGKFALVAIMERGKDLGNDQPDGLKNGHWEFATFKPDGSPAKKDLNGCRACHAPLTATNHLFSMEHLTK